MSKRMESLIFSLAGALALLSINFKSPRFDSDIFWSMAIGEWITTHKAFPFVDSFSWTINGREWMTHEWLYCFGSYHLYSIWGNVGLYALSLLPIMLTVYFLYRMGKHCDLTNSYAFLLVLTIGTLLLYQTTLLFRAYVYALLFFTILVYLLYFKKESKSDYLYYSLLFVAWSNVHISVCMGIIILAIEMMRRIIVNTRAYGLWLTAVSVVATLINPYGYKIWTYFWFTLTSMGESRLISEWQAPNFGDPTKLVLYVILASSIIFLQYYYRDESLFEQKPKSDSDIIIENQRYHSAGHLLRLWHLFQGFAQKRLTLSTSLLVLFWGFYLYSLYSIRMIFYTIILWIVVTSIFAGKIRRLDFTFRTVYLLAGLFVLFFSVNFICYRPNAKNLFEYNQKISPVEEVAFLKENPKYRYHLFNSYIYGGYLILNDIPVFIDARSDSYIMFGLMNKYGDVVGLEKDPQELFDELGVQNIMFNNSSPLSWYLGVNTAWQLVHEGPNACIYTRAGSSFNKNVYY